MVIRVLVLSRVLVLLSGVLAAGLIGTHAGNAATFDPAGLARSFPDPGDLLLGTWARWDSVWFLSISAHGYDSDATAAFFPLYPAAIELLGGFAGIGSAIVAGLAVSLGSLAAGLWFVHRLAEIEAGKRAADLAVMALAFFPAAFFFSAVYSESLFLACSAGAFYFARTERWAAAGLAGIAAAATRNVGVALVVPLLVLWLAGRRRRIDLAAIGLVPLGTAAFALITSISRGNPVAFIDAQQDWDRHISPFGPFGGLWDGISAAGSAVGDLVSGRESLVLWSLHGPPVLLTTQNLELAAFALLAIVGTIGAVRLLPAAYGAWSAVALAVPLAAPRADVPLFSISRYVLVLFPVFIWIGVVLSSRPRLAAAWVALSAVLLAYYTARFATWQWVA